MVVSRRHAAWRVGRRAARSLQPGGPVVGTHDVFAARDAYAGILGVYRYAAHRVRARWRREHRPYPRPPAPMARTGRRAREKRRVSALSARRYAAPDRAR